MPLPAYMFLKGETQGEINGSSSVTKRHGAIVVQEFKHRVHIPRASFQGASGKRAHDPLVITKVFDKSSPLLYKALCENERIEGELKFYRINSLGQQEHYYSITFRNAIIVTIAPFMPNCQDRSLEHYQPMEEVSIAYETITWTWEESGIEYQDSWLSAV
jgi:type VI secretion system secreted protein Hcp